VTAALQDAYQDEGALEDYATKAINNLI